MLYRLNCSINTEILRDTAKTAPFALKFKWNQPSSLTLWKYINDIKYLIAIIQSTVILSFATEQIFDNFIGSSAANSGYNERI